MSKHNLEKMEHFISLLDAYLDGELPSEQTQEIKVALKEDEFLKKVLEQHVQARANIRIAGEAELKTKFKNSFEDIPDEPKSRSKWTKILAAILLIAGILSLIYFFMTKIDQPEKSADPVKNKTTNQVQLAELEDPSYELMRSDNTSDSLLKIWNKAIIQFSDKKYQQTLSTLSNLDSDQSFMNENSGKLKLMKGVCLFHLDKFEEAINNLEQIKESNPYFDQSQWYKAVTYRQSGHSENYRKMLNEIIQTPQHYKRSQALELLENIK